MFPMTDRRPYIAYFLILAVGVAVWWAVILGSAEIRGWFFSDVFGKGEYYLFLIPDLLVIIVGSAMVCWFAVVNSWQPMRWAIWFVTGAMSYATLLTFSLYSHLQHCTLAAVLIMAAGTAGCFWMAIQASRFETQTSTST